MKNNSDKKIKKNIAKIKKNKRKFLNESVEMLPENDSKKTTRMYENITEMETDEPKLNFNDYEEQYLDDYAKEQTDEKYAKKRSRDEYYKKDESETEEIFAKRLRGGKMVNYYAQTVSKRDTLAKIQENDKWVAKEYIRDENENQIYPYNPEENRYYYKYDEDGEPIFALDKDNNPYYPSKKDPTTGDFIQYIPTKLDDEPVYITTIEGKQKYPENVTKQIPVYPKDSEGNEFYLKDENQEPYYLEHEGNQIYAKNKNDIDTVIVRNGEEIYATINNGQKQIYPRQHTLKRTVCIYNQRGEPIFALDENQQQYYPDRIDGLTNETIQYIPYDIGTHGRTGEPFPIKEDGIELYPMNLTRNIYIYPRAFGGDEYYLLNSDGKPYYIEIERTEKYASDKNGKNILLVKDNVPVYARADNDANGKKEIYPHLGTGQSQFYKRIKDEEVAALRNVEETIGYYARDEHENEIYPKKYFLSDDMTDNNSDASSQSGEED